MANPTPYILLGHGSEAQVDFGARPRIPPGYTLVTLAECGAVTTIDEVAALMDTFSRPGAKNILENPRTHKGAVEAIVHQPVHVYTEGMAYPAMTLQLFADWEVKGKERRAVKSGVYRFPTESTSWVLNPDANTWENRLFGSYPVSGMYNPVITHTEDFAERFYTGSIFPTVDEVRQALAASKGNVERFSKAMRFSLEDVFERGGPGVYYYVICRSPQESNLGDYVTTYITDVPGDFEEAKNVIPYIPTLLPQMSALAEERRGTIAKRRAALAAKQGVPLSEFVPSAANRYAIEGWNAETVLGAPAKFEKLYANTMHIRRASMNQQGLPFAAAATANTNKKTRRRRRHRRTRRLYKRL